MDLGLDRTFFHCLEPVVDTTVFREETTEAIVPDTCPDIDEILDTQAEIRFLKKEIQDGYLTISGTLCAGILCHATEDESSVFHMEVSVPFECQVDQASLTADCKAVIQPSLQSADARALNPRKVLFRAEIAITVLAAKPTELPILSSVTGEAGIEIQQKLLPISSFATVSMEEQEITLRDTVHLTGNISEILDTCVTPVCSESRVIGGKLIVKGTICWQILSNGNDGLNRAEFELPFSIVMEAGSAGEDSLITLVPLIKEISCTSENNECTLTLTLLVQSMIREECTLQFVSDLYSTSHMLHITSENFCLRQLLECHPVPIALREQLDTPSLVHRVVSCCAVVGLVTKSEEDGQFLFQAPISMSALCEGDSGTLFAVSGVFTASVRTDRPAGASAYCTCNCAGAAYATPVAGGIEFRIPLQFFPTVYSERPLAIVSNADLEDNTPISNTERPSLVLRPIRLGEQLWDIAKEYRTTVEYLMRVNELSDEAVIAGRLLLIPKCR